MPVKPSDIEKLIQTSGFSADYEFFFNDGTIKYDFDSATASREIAERLSNLNANYMKAGKTIIIQF